MKKTVSIMALCALSVILSGCLKKKDKDAAMTTGETTGERSASMEKPIKVASLSDKVADLSTEGPEKGTKEDANEDAEDLDTKD